jgi:SAM-dependent methyltransferase
MQEQFDRWLTGLETRHLADLRFADVSRSLRAVSSAYVERRSRIADGAVLGGAGKRAAFALFYGPLHFLLVRHIVSALPRRSGCPATLVDLGCGTGAAGAALADVLGTYLSVIGIDRHRWALGEAAQTYRQFGISSRTRLGDVASMKLPHGPALFVAAFTINELEDAGRERVVRELVDLAAQGSRLLIVEPLARFVAPWWERWAEAVVRAGGRADEWRFRAELPPIVAKLDRAAGLNHRELTGRSLAIL